MVTSFDHGGDDGPNRRNSGCAVTLLSPMTTRSNPILWPVSSLKTLGNRLEDPVVTPLRRLSSAFSAGSRNPVCDRRGQLYLVLRVKVLFTVAYHCCYYWLCLWLRGSPFLTSTGWRWLDPTVPFGHLGTSCYSFAMLLIPYPCNSPAPRPISPLDLPFRLDHSSSSLVDGWAALDGNSVAKVSISKR